MHGEIGEQRIRRFVKVDIVAEIGEIADGVEIGAGLVEVHDDHFVIAEPGVQHGSELSRGVQRLWATFERNGTDLNSKILRVLVLMLSVAG